MPKDLKDFPRPANDNGRGLHGSFDCKWMGGEQGLDYWVNLLVELNIKWFKVIDDAGSSAPLCAKLLAAGIFPIVRILRRDPPPNDTPEPNPGHLGSPEEKTLRQLIDLGVCYFETNNEPNLASEWKTQAFPGNPLEAAKLVALNWLFDARLILSMGAFPGLPAVSSGGDMDLIGALATLGRHDILLEGCWIALHNYCGNRPLTYPDDPISRTGLPLTDGQHAQQASWVWWSTAHGRPDSPDEINELRANLANPAATIQHDHACFREFEYYDTLAMKYLGRSIPIISTEGGYRVGRREDIRYPRVTPSGHCEQTVALFDFMQRQAPDYYFAATPTLLIESEEHEHDAWHSAFWQRAMTNPPYGFDGVPNIALMNGTLGNQLPVIDAVKQMQNLARRMPGAQPTPPVQPAMPFEHKPVTLPPPIPSEPVKAEPTPQTEFPSWLRDTPLPTKVPPTLKSVQAKPKEKEIEPAVPTPVASTQPMVEQVPLPPPPVAIKPTPPVEEQVPPPPASVVTEPTPKPVEPVVAPTKEKRVEPIIKPAEEKPIVEKVFEPIVSKPVEKRKIDSTPPPPPPEHISHEEKPPAERRAPMVETQPLSTPLGAVEELEWDWRLDALGVVVEPANVKPGQAYWKLVRAEYQAPNESNDAHQILYTVLDQQNRPVEYQKVLQGWVDGETDAITNENGETRIPMWLAYSPDHMEQGPYVAWVDGLACDRVRGMGLPSKRHVSFNLTWKRSVATFLDTERRR
ncbi:MAG: hypothetical protein HZB51_02755 [Chloroflexi bacterium]|nr:hypothetical protein [Chloroflexota bacterium]